MAAPSVFAPDRLRRRGLAATAIRADGNDDRDGAADSD